MDLSFWDAPVLGPEQPGVTPVEGGDLISTPPAGSPRSSPMPVQGPLRHPAPLVGSCAYVVSLSDDEVSEAPADRCAPCVEGDDSPDFGGSDDDQCDSTFLSQPDECLPNASPAGFATPQQALSPSAAEDCRGSQPSGQRPASPDDELAAALAVCNDSEGNSPRESLPADERQDDEEVQDSDCELYIPEAILNPEAIDQTDLAPMERVVVKLLVKLTRDDRLALWNKLAKLECWRHASLCSGSGCDGALQEMLFKRIHSDLSVEPTYVCEKDARKQAWLLDVTANAGGTGAVPCLYPEIADTAALKCECMQPAHGAMKGKPATCEVPTGPRGPNILSAGTSCKEFSKLKLGFAQMRSCIRDKSGTSGATYHGFIRHVVTHEPPLVILENVAELLQPANRQNLKDYIQMLRDAGYAAKVFKMKADRNGLPCRRPRCYTIAVHLVRTCMTHAHAHKALQQVFEIVDQLTLIGECEPFEQFVMSNDDPRVERVLREMLEKKQDEKLDAVWQKQHRGALDEQGLSWSSCVPSAKVQASPWYPALCTREKMQLGYQRQCSHKMTLDLTQALMRVPSSSLQKAEESDEEAVELIEVCSTLLPNSRVWVSEIEVDRGEGDDEVKGTAGERLLTGAEMLALQGYPNCHLDSHAAIIARHSNALLGDLAGNMFSGGTYLTVFLAVLVAMPLQALTPPVFRCLLSLYYIVVP